MKTIYLAGGCFWGTEHYIKQFDGIIETVTGYAGGNIPNPSYEQVYTDQTGHVECVKVTFDEKVLPLKTLLKLFFISIDPLQKDGQANDIGTRYRTGIYWIDEQDRLTVEDVYAEIESCYEAALSEKIEPKTLAVETGPLQCFYPAEEYHQDYLTKNPDGYCHISSATQHFAKIYANLTKGLKAQQELSKEEKHPYPKDDSNITNDSSYLRFLVDRILHSKRQRAHSRAIPRPTRLPAHRLWTRSMRHSLG